MKSLTLLPMAALLGLTAPAMLSGEAAAQRSAVIDPTDDEEEGAAGDDPGTTTDEKLMEQYRKQPFKAIVGLGAFTAPDYLGSNQYEWKPMIVVDLKYRNRLWFRGRALGVNAVYTRHFRVGAMGRVNFGRQDHANGALFGMGDVPPSLEAGAFAEGRWQGWSLRLSGYHDVTGAHGGALARVRLQYETRFWRAFYIRANAFANWASNDYMDAFFSVNALQSRRSGYPVYNADAGFRDVGGAFALTFSFHRHWGLLLRGRYTYIVGDAADSPIVRTRHQGFVGLALFYRY